MKALIVSGRDAILAYFRDVFTEVRSAATGAPSLQILPAVQGLRIQMVGNGVAVVTFELGHGRSPGRRTLVWAWNARRHAWELQHLHASRQAAD